MIPAEGAAIAGIVLGTIIGEKWTPWSKAWQAVSTAWWKLLKRMGKQ